MTTPPTPLPATPTPRVDAYIQSVVSYNPNDIRLARDLERECAALREENEQMRAALQHDRLTFEALATEAKQQGRDMTAEVWRHHVDAITRALGSSRESKWQPIESAPKDGRVIMGWIGMPWFFCWTEEHGWHGVFPMENAYSLMWLRFSANQPTMWQPLPEPPAARRALGKEGE